MSQPSKFAVLVLVSGKRSNVMDHTTPFTLTRLEEAVKYRLSFPSWVLVVWVPILCTLGSVTQTSANRAPFVIP